VFVAVGIGDTQGQVAYSFSILYLNASGFVLQSLNKVTTYGQYIASLGLSLGYPCAARTM